MEIEIARPDNKGELSVSLRKRGEDEGAFSIPETVTLPDGSYAVSIPVEVDLSELLAGSSLSATILISDRQEETGTGSAYVTQFSDKINLSVSFALDWEPYLRTDESGNKVQQTATYTYNAFYTGHASGLKVEKAVGANIFKVNDWASGVSFKFILNEDNTCTVPAQSIGYYNSNYNEYVKVSGIQLISMHLRRQGQFLVLPDLFRLFRLFRQRQRNPGIRRQRRQDAGSGDFIRRHRDDRYGIQGSETVFQQK